MSVHPGLHCSKSVCQAILYFCPLTPRPFVLFSLLSLFFEVENFFPFFLFFWEFFLPGFLVWSVSPAYPAFYNGKYLLQQPSYLCHCIIKIPLFRVRRPRPRPRPRPRSRPIPVFVHFPCYWAPPIGPLHLHVLASMRENTSWLIFSLYISYLSSTSSAFISIIILGHIGPSTSTCSWLLREKMHVDWYLIRMSVTSHSHPQPLFPSSWRKEWVTLWTYSSSELFFRVADSFGIQVCIHSKLKSLQSASQINLIQILQQQSLQLLSWHSLTISFYPKFYGWCWI